VLFVDDVDRGGYLALLGDVVVRQSWRCLSYCLMDNHVHLLIETPEPNLADGMRRLHGGFAQRLNRRHGASGHVFQGRYGSKRLRNEGHLWTAAAYIAANPVDAGICASPEQWSWSSHAWATATVEARSLVPRWLDLGRLDVLLSAAGGDPRRRYLDAVAERCGRRPPG
jgi:REP element-mobilizing transposase RayT